MNLSLSKDLREFGRSVREWSVEHARPYARAVDDQHALPENWHEILDTAPFFLGRHDKEETIPSPTFEEGPAVVKAVFLENLCYGDVWAAMVLGRGIGPLVVSAMGTPEQIERWAGPSIRSAFALTEPQFGSDTSMVATSATRDEDSWVLNGSKIYCTNGARADNVVVFATTDAAAGPKAVAAFVVPRDTEGMVVIRENEMKLGIRGWGTSALSFDSCRVPLDHRLGWTGDDEPVTRSGRSGALSALSHNRPYMASWAIGVAQASLDQTQQMVDERRDDFTAVRRSQIDVDFRTMNDALDRGRRLIYAAQYRVDQNEPDAALSAMAKAYSPHTCERIIRRCMQMLGPEGASHALLLEKWYRDVKILDIFEGSGQVQRIIVGRTLMGRSV